MRLSNKLNYLLLLLDLELLFSHLSLNPYSSQSQRPSGWGNLELGYLFRKDTCLRHNLSYLSNSFSGDFSSFFFF